MAKIIFFGTPNFVLPVLDELNKHHNLVAVVTQPPKPVGRKGIITSSPVAQWAKKHSIKVLDSPPKKLVHQIKELKPETGILAAYGRILSADILKVFPKGIINIHPSLLAKHRGPSPVAAAIVSGDKETGVTIIKLDSQMDHGPIISQFKEDIKSDDTRESLRNRLFEQAAEVLVTILPPYLEGRVELREQEHKKATYNTLIEKSHGFIPPQYLEAALHGGVIRDKWNIPFIKDFSLDPSPATVYNFIRALDPWPGVWTKVKLTSNTQQVTRRLKLLKAHVEDGKLVLDQVQLEGKGSVSFQQLLQGHPDLKFVIHA